MLLSAGEIRHQMTLDMRQFRLSGSPILTRSLSENTSMLKKNDIPPAWRSCLTGLQQFWPDAVLAGGALRDRDNGVKPKDLDFFIPAHRGGMEDVADVYNVLKKAGWEVNKADAYDYARPGVIGLVEIKHVGCPPIQLVVGKWDTAKIEEHFDFGICQIVFDGREVRQTLAYRADQIRKCFTYLGRAEDIGRSVDRFARIKPRYPGWLFALKSNTTYLNTAIGSSRYVQHGPNLMQVPKI